MHDDGVTATALTSPRVLLSGQTLAAGNGGICTVARMTAAALSGICEIRALACQDQVDHQIGTVPVRAFNDRRFRFALANLFDSRWATHVIYDFAGTARAHIDLPLSRRPYAVWIHGLEVWQEAPQKYLRTVAGANLVLANSAYTLARAQTTLLKGVDVRICQLGTTADTAPAVVGPSQGPPTVMLLGRADELFAKGHDILIEVWPQVASAVPGARLLFVGGGNALGVVRALAASSPAGEAIEIAGFVTDEHIDAYWQRATVFAMLGFAEGFGIVYADAMRHGLPIVASTDDGGQEVNVDGVTGLNVSRSDKKRLIEVLVTLLRNRDYGQALGAAGHSRWREIYSFSAFKQRLVASTNGFLSA